MKAIQGFVRGRTIQLMEDLGLGEGQEVQVVVTAVPRRQAWGEGLRRCAGALADQWSEEDDRILEELHRERSQNTRRELVRRVESERF